MKRAILILGLLLPLAVGAHGGAGSVEIDSQEWQDVSPIMEKMMSSQSLTSEEAVAMTDFMADHGGYGMMMGGAGYGYGMMGGYNMMSGVNHGGGLWYWLMVVGAIVWILVGVLLIAFLANKIEKKK